MTDTEEIEKRKKQIEENEKNVGVGVKAKQKDITEVVVKDIEIPFLTALELTVKFFFAGLIVALPIWLIVLSV